MNADRTLADSPNPRSPWLWLAAALLAAITVPPATEFALSRQRPYPEEHRRLSAVRQPNSEQIARMMSIAWSVRIANVRQVLVACLVPMTIAFGLVGGWIYRRVGWATLGTVAGIAIGIAVTMLSSSQVLRFQRDATSVGNDMAAIALHAVQWLIIGAGATIAILVGSKRIRVFGHAAGALVAAAAAMGSLYVLIGSALDPNHQTGLAVPIDGEVRYLWTSLPPLIVGGILTWTHLRSGIRPGIGPM